eukprot:gene6368-4575_t
MVSYGNSEEDNAVDRNDELDNDDDDDRCNESPSLDSCSPEEEDLHDEKPTTKRRKRVRQYAHLIPRIVKHDIRRLYSRMLINVLNQHDVAFYQSFLETYGHATNLSLIVEGLQPPNAAYASSEYPNAYCMRGVRDMVCFEAVGLRLKADSVYTLDTVTIYSRSDTLWTEVHCHVAVSHTSHYQADIATLHQDLIAASAAATEPSLDLPHGQTSVADADASADVGSDGSQSHVMRVYQPAREVAPIRLPDVFDVHRQRTGESLPLRKDPHHVTAKLTLILKINERRQLEQLYARKSHWVFATPATTAP